jgi:hypothetical protein
MGKTSSSSKKAGKRGTRAARKGSEFEEGILIETGRYRAGATVSIWKRYGHSAVGRRSANGEYWLEDFEDSAE